MPASQPQKGTHYTPRKTQQGSYFLPPGLRNAFKEFCNGNASTGMRGAMVLFMACRQFPNLRDRAIRAAQQMEIGEAVKAVEAQLIEDIGDAYIAECVRDAPKSKKAEMLAALRKRE